METHKNRAVVVGTLTLREWHDFVEKHGHPPNWPPDHTHTKREARRSQSDRTSNGTNQAPPHRSSFP
jgi:hypothetical protein